MRKTASERLSRSNRREIIGVCVAAVVGITGGILFFPVVSQAFQPDTRWHQVCSDTTKEIRMPDTTCGKTDPDTSRFAWVYYPPNVDYGRIGASTADGRRTHPHGVHPVTGHADGSLVRGEW